MRRLRNKKGRNIPMVLLVAVTGMGQMFSAMGQGGTAALDGRSKWSKGKMLEGEKNVYGADTYILEADF